MRTLFILLLAIPSIGYSQQLVENNIDDFTHSSIKRSEWIKLETAAFENSMTTFVRTTKINDFAYLDFKIMTGTVFSIQENDKLMIKLSNDSIITLICVKYAITCHGCGAVGFVGSEAEGLEATYILKQDQQKYLTTNAIEKIRIYESGGYLEAEINEKHAKKLQKCLELISN